MATQSKQQSKSAASSQSPSSSGRAEATPTTERVRAVGHEAVDNAADKAEGVEKKLRSEASRLSEQAEERTEDVKQQFEQSLDKLERFIKDKPVAATGIAFASGAVLALLLKR